MIPDRKAFAKLAAQVQEEREKMQKPDFEGVAREMLMFLYGQDFEEEWVVEFERHIRNAHTEGWNAGLEAAASLHESMNAACDHERQRGDPGAGSMGVIVEYRDAIRALKVEKPET